MISSQTNGSPRRANPFSRGSMPTSPVPSPKHSRAKSALVSMPVADDTSKTHMRNSSVSSIPPTAALSQTARDRPTSKSNGAAGTFAPEFIKSEELRRGAAEIKGLEGDNDFSGNKYVWLHHPETAFVRGLVVEEREGGKLLVRYDDGKVIETGALPDRIRYNMLTPCLAMRDRC